MINRSFVLLPAIACCVCFVGQLNAQKTIVNPAAMKPATVEPAPSKPASMESSATPTASEKAPDEVKPAAAAKPAGFLTQNLLPATTKAWISIPDAKDLTERFDRSQFGELAKNKTLKPFADSIKKQVKDLIDQQNVRLNLDVDQLEGVNSGEICFAGVLREGGQHGVVFLMDVSDTRDKAAQLRQRITKKLMARDATKKEGVIQGVEYTHLTLDKPKLFRTPRNTFHTIVDVKGDFKSSWMLVSNNEAVFRDVLRRLTNPERIQAVETLAAQPSFQTVMKQTDSADSDSQIKWFVDPFGYLELAQKIRDEESPSRIARTGSAEKLANAGFDAFRGIGGQVSVMTGEHEVLHKTFIYAKKLKAGQEQVFELLDFNTNKGQPHSVPRWVPEEASSVIIGDWNSQKALKAFGHFWDAQTKPGSWKQVLIDLKQDPNLQFDLEGVVDQIGNRFVIVAASEKPIGPESERVVISITLKGRAEFVFDNLSRANPDARIIKVGKHKFIEIDSTREPEGPELKIEELDLEDPDSLQDLEEGEEEEPKRFELFEKRYLVVSGNELLVANNKNFLKKILARRKSELESAPDYIRVKKTLKKLTDDTRVAWRQFGRLDKGLETNYEMMRRGEMASSQTMLARVVNRIFNNQAAEKARLEGKEFDADAVRKQELDGAKLPADFSKAIAPYLGPTGSVVEVMDDGWRISGVVLNRDNGPTLNPSDVPDPAGAADNETAIQPKLSEPETSETSQAVPMNDKTAKKP